MTSWEFEIFGISNLILISFGQLSGLHDSFLRNTREIFTKDILLSEKSILQKCKYQQRQDIWKEDT